MSIDIGVNLTKSKIISLGKTSFLSFLFIIYLVGIMLYELVNMKFEMKQFRF